MKKVLFLTFFLLHSLPSMACFCMPPPKLERISQLDKYSFIALVYVTDEVNNERLGSTLQFRIKELFKGDRLREAYEPMAGSSCDIGISKGKEWLLYGFWVDGKLMIRACDRNTRSKDALILLRHMFRKEKIVYANGIERSFYSSGKIASEKNYLNNQLNGERKVWHSNGQLNGRENYLNDTLDGKAEWFYETGQIKAEYWYRKGKAWNISRTYYDTAILKVLRHYKATDIILSDHSKVQVESETVYNTDGTFLMQREYSITGKILSEHIMKDSVLSIRINYHKNGKVSSINNLRHNKPFGQFHEFNEDGSLNRAGEHD